MSQKQTLLGFPLVVSDAMPPGTGALVPTRDPRPDELRVSSGEPPELVVDFDKYLENLTRESVLIVNMAPLVDWRKCPHADPKQPGDGLSFAVGAPCYIYCCSKCFATHEACKETCLVLDKEG